MTVNVRPTQSSLFGLVRSGIYGNTLDTIRAQEQIASGRRILRPSDDPVGLSRALSLRRQIAQTERFAAAAQDTRALLDTASGAVENAGGILSRARELVLQGLNGTLVVEDRRILATEIQALRDQLLDVANTRFDDRFLFGGTESGRQPFVSTGAGVAYAGNGEEVRVPIGEGASIAANLSGQRLFAAREAGSTSYAGSTGAARGQTADQGSGYRYLEVRHDATTGALSAGLAFANGGAGDTLLGDRTLRVDGAAGTAQLGAGPVVTLPAPGDPGAADLVLRDEHGAELHLDVSGFTGGTVTTTVRGDGSLSLDGATYLPIDFVDTDLRVSDPSDGTVLHVDTTGIRQAGHELVTFAGTGSVFDVLDGLVEDLNDVHGLPIGAVHDRLTARLAELDRHQQNVLEGLGVLGARSASLSNLETRLSASSVETQGLLSSVEDADLSEVILDLTRAQTSLQATQAAGVRLLQTSLLNFLN